MKGAFHFGNNNAENYFYVSSSASAVFLHQGLPSSSLPFPSSSSLPFPSSSLSFLSLAGDKWCSSVPVASSTPSTTAGQEIPTEIAAITAGISWPGGVCSRNGRDGCTNSQIHLHYPSPCRGRLHVQSRESLPPLVGVLCYGSACRSLIAC
ncbi:hypothetical protein Patl1_16748 [Pistacia atlantica]|uniref:Uncharacterized protein n=1 Tax=Pistacia atlantica TaxID=434234 RepID=A0ACC1B9P5_9ROSI|nr:hypothetical protein Patl1_16748 [Pistacia atlantica]